MARSWSDLPIELLLITINKLNDMLDFVYFGAVCRQWRTILWLYHNNIQPQKLPLPLLATKATISDRYFNFSLVNLGNGVHKKTMSEHNIDDCYSADYGWLLTVDFFGRYPFLINPFLTTNNSIELPNQLEFTKAIKKCVLSDNPARTSDYVVMVMYDDNLNFFASDNGCWTQITFPSGETCQDGIYYKASGCFYFITSEGTLECIEMVSNLPIVKSLQSINSLNGGLKLVESSSGELLCVARLSPAGNVPFAVYKLCGSGESYYWSILLTLCDHTVFLDENPFMLFSDSDRGIFKPNHIYYYEDNYMKGFSVVNESYHLLRLENFSMEKKVMWVQPTSNMTNFALADTEHQYTSSTQIFQNVGN